MRWLCAGAAVVSAWGTGCAEESPLPPAGGMPHRIERLECEREPLPLDAAADPQQWPMFLVSETFEPVLRAAAAIDVQWEAERGLSLTTGDAPGQVELPAPLMLGGPRAEVLELETSSPRDLGLRIHWTDERCAAFSDACSASLRLPAGERSRSRVEVASLVRGAVGRLRLGLPAGSRLVIHRARVAPAIGAGGRTLIGPGAAPQLLAANELALERGARGRVRVRVAPGAGDPHFGWRSDVDAGRSTRLVVRTPGRAAGSVDAFFVGPLCDAEAPGFTAACKVRADAPVDADHWILEMAQHPLWVGNVTRLRLDLDGIGSEPFELEVVADDAGEPSGLARDADGEAAGLRRFDVAGPLGWELPVGAALVCEIPERGAPPLELPAALEVNFPPDAAPLRFLELQAWWVDAAGGRKRALFHQEAASRRADSGWQALPLGTPAKWPAALRVELTCARNCTALDEPGRRVEVARPLVRRPLPAGEAPFRSLILVVLDTLRADHLSLYGYAESTDPMLREFAAGAVVYDRAIAVGTRTIPTHAALFTGRYPLDAGPSHYDGLPDDSRTLASVLAAKGYRTFAQTDGPYVSPEYGFDIGFDRFDAVFEPTTHKFDRFVEQAADARASGAPYFGFLHTYAVHEPYSVAPGERLGPPATEAGPRFPVPSTPLRRIGEQLEGSSSLEAAAAHLSAEYDRGIEVLDADLGRLLEALSKRGLLDDTLIVVTSDHGEEFAEHGRLGHGRQLPHEELAWIPLVVRDPGEGVGGRRVARPISQAEVPGMLLSRLGFEVPWESRCVEPGRPASFVSTRWYRDHPIGDYFTAAVHLGECHYWEVSARATERIVASGFAGVRPDVCREQQAALREVLACMKDVQRERGHYGAAGPVRTNEALDPVLDDARRRQLEALGYVD